MASDTRPDAPILRCASVDMTWAAGTPRAHAALAGLDLDVAPNEFLVLLGPSGCGKSTLLYLMAGLERHTAGRVEWLGKAVTGSPSQVI